MLVRRQICDRIGAWDEKLPCAQDWDVGIRISKVSAVDIVAEVLVNMGSMATGSAGT